MPRFDPLRAFLHGASGAVQAAPSGNPLAIGGNAAIQALLGGFTGNEKFDPKPYLKDFQDYKTDALKDLAPLTREAVSGVNQDMASRGLGYSPVAAGIAAGNQRALQTDALRQLRGQEHTLRQDLKQAEMVDQRQRSSADKSAILALLGQVGGLSADVLSGQPTNKQGITNIRSWLGLPDSKPTDMEGLTDAQSILDSIPKRKPTPSADEVTYPNRTDEVLGPDAKLPQVLGYPSRRDEVMGPSSPVDAAPDITSAWETQKNKGMLEFNPNYHSNPNLPAPDAQPDAFFPDSETQPPTGMTPTGDLDLMGLELPIRADIFADVNAGGGTNENMIRIDGTDLAVPSDSTFGMVYQRYKPRFDLLHTQLPGGIMEFIEAFTMPAFA